MTALLELRENLKKIYSRNEAFILPVIKFLLSFIVLSIINGKMGYMTKIDNMASVLIVSLLCSFLPTGFMVVFAMLFTLLHMYALSIETAAVGLVVFLLLYLSARLHYQAHHPAQTSIHTIRHRPSCE